MYVDIVISNVFNLNKTFFSFFLFFAVKLILYIGGSRQQLIYGACLVPKIQNKIFSSQGFFNQSSENTFKLKLLL